MGRQVRLHVLLVAQSATARAIGSPEMRENFATRILVRYTPLPAGGIPRKAWELPLLRGKWSRAMIHLSLL